MQYEDSHGHRPNTFRHKPAIKLFLWIGPLFFVEAAPPLTQLWCGPRWILSRVSSTEKWGVASRLVAKVRARFRVISYEYGTIHKTVMFLRGPVRFVSAVQWIIHRTTSWLFLNSPRNRLHVVRECCQRAPQEPAANKTSRCREKLFTCNRRGGSAVRLRASRCRREQRVIFFSLPAALLRPQTSALRDVRRRSLSGLSAALRTSPSHRIAPRGKESTPQLNKSFRYRSILHLYFHRDASMMSGRFFCLLDVKLGKLRRASMSHVCSLPTPKDAAFLWMPYPWALHTHTAFSLSILHAWSPIRQWELVLVFIALGKTCFPPTSICIQLPVIHALIAARGNEMFHLGLVRAVVCEMFLSFCLEWFKFMLRC